jgi:hypothetical protein
MGVLMPLGMLPAAFFLSATSPLEKEYGDDQAND